MPYPTPGADIGIWGGELNTQLAVSINTDGTLKPNALVNFVKAGTPTDTDFTAPVDGLIVVDTVGLKLWVRLGGVWQVPVASGVSGPMATRTVAGSYTIVLSDQIIRCNFSVSATITLPTPTFSGAVAGSPGKSYWIKKVDATAAVVTVSGTVDGIVNPTLVTQYDSFIAISNGAAYDSW